MPAAQHAEDLIEGVVKVPAKVIGQEAEDEVTMDLEESVLAPVTTVGGGVS